MPFSSSSNSDAEGSRSEGKSIRKIGAPSRRDRLRDLTSRTKTRARKLFKLERLQGFNDGNRLHENGLHHAVDGDPAFNPSMLVNEDRSDAPGAKGKAGGILRTVGDTVANPVEAIKSKATRATAGKLSQAERPYLSPKADLRLLEAHTNLGEAESSRPSRLDNTEYKQSIAEDKFRGKVEKLEAHRESLRVAWITSRHVDRVRVVPRQYMNFPDRESFAERDLEGAAVRYRWENWIGHVSTAQQSLLKSMWANDGDNVSCSSTIRKTLVANISTTLENYPTIWILCGIMSND